MALRDPGAPRRNPLFSVDEPASAQHEPRRGEPADAGDDGWDDWADDPIFGGAGDPLFGAPGSAVGPLISALTEAGPEAAEHLVNAAHEFTLAIKVVVDAFERSLAEQRAAFEAEHPTPPVDFGIDLDDDVEIHLDDAPPARPPGHQGAPRVQNIDLE
jgi:hypothetical protein